jgi:hypothetical protein
LVPFSLCSYKVEYCKQSQEVSENWHQGQPRSVPTPTFFLPGGTGD